MQTNVTQDFTFNGRLNLVMDDMWDSYRESVCLRPAPTPGNTTIENVLIYMLKPTAIRASDSCDRKTVTVYA